MARIRTIKPEFWTHPVMGRVDDSSKCMALALLNFADDEGYFLADPNLVRSSCRPFDDDSTITRRCLATLSKSGWIEVKEHPTHGSIGVVVNFTGHQNIDRSKASKLSIYFLDDESSNPRRSIASGREGKGMEGNGKTVTPRRWPWMNKHDDDVVETTQQVMEIYPDKSNRQPNGDSIPKANSADLAERLGEIKKQGGSLVVCVEIFSRFVDEYHKGAWAKAPQNFFGIGTKEKPSPWKSYYKAHLTNEDVADAS